MPRKQFRADLTAASAVPDFGHITAVEPGEDDGDFTFLFIQPGTGIGSQITAMLETSDYPSTHDYQLFAADDASAAVAGALQKCPSLSGRPIQEALPLLSSFLAAQTATGGRTDPVPLDIDSDVDMPDSQSVASDEDAEGGENEDWALEDDAFTEGYGGPARSNSNAINDVQDSDQATKRARADLRAVKDAGFKVGVIGKLGPGCACYVSIACRISKLGISEEAQDAWALDPAEYVILLLYFPFGYRSLDFFESIDAVNGRTRLTMAVGVSDTYKPRTLAEAQRAFATGPNDTQPQKDAEADNSGLRECFISRPLNNLLNDRFTTILKYRLAMGFPWSGAERYYNDSLGAARHHADYANAEYSRPEEVPDALPAIVTDDEITTSKSTKELSLPLVIMQFLLRHLVRCTDFCLVCHSKLASEVEAIKPYVCDNPLCLYQYMSLGFGPSIEHEIISQPYVVDLLISFCYASAASTNLHSYPDGLGLMVPDPEKRIGGSKSALEQNVVAYGGFPGAFPGDARQEGKGKTDASRKDGGQFAARFDNATNELLFEDYATKTSKSPLRLGQWLVINPEQDDQVRPCSWHCRVIETHLFPTVRVSEPVVLRQQNLQQGKDKATEGTSQERPRSGWTDVRIHPYDQNINDLDKTRMSSTLMVLLDLLPSVTEMKDYLTSKPGASLSLWHDRINPAALGILRWIIASNRSCIMQVDRMEDNESSRKKAEERVEGLPGWLQFRFAMGAPDKEQRFINSISTEKAGADHPTLFAWHGSPLANWHSIIREGLHFNKTSHGRAYGNGCYHAKDFGTSGGYSGMGGGGRSYSSWPKSVLGIDQAIALSEIVNAPDKFVSNTPYYVVAQLDCEY